MNVPFFLRDEALNDAFLAGARERGLLQLKGHKSVGGMRASIYNAMPLEGVQALVAYMRRLRALAMADPAASLGADPTCWRCASASTRVDRELLALLNRRAALALEVGELKKKEGSVVFRPEREAQVIDGLKAVNPGPLKTDSVAPIWREIMSACRALETPTRVAYLGPAGTFSEEAALGFFGSSIVRVPCASIDEVFRTTSRRRRRLRRGAGGELAPKAWSRARSTCSSPRRCSSSARPACSCGTTCCAATNALDGIAGRVRASAGAGAMPRLAVQPPAACRAAAGVQQRRRRAPGGARPARWPPSPARAPAASTACTWSRPAIQDDPHNRTRFAIVTRPDRHPVPQASGHDCTSLVVSVPNRPGAVHDMLVPLKQHGVSMTRFESRPARSGQWEFARPSTPALRFRR